MAAILPKLPSLAGRQRAAIGSSTSTSTSSASSSSVPAAALSTTPGARTAVPERRRPMRQTTITVHPYRSTTVARAAQAQQQQQGGGPVVGVGPDGEAVAPRPWKPEAEVPGMTAYLDSLRWSKDGLVPVIAQNVDTGELLMQAYSDRAAVCETLQTGLATFYSRSRAERWCKGETSGAYIRVLSVHADCDRDSLVYLGDPIGPACHTGARTCWFTRAGVLEEQKQHDHGHEHDHECAGVSDRGDPERHDAGAPLTTLLALERTIAERRREAEEERAAGTSATPGKKPSWTARLLADEALLCKKVREEAGELCETLEKQEGRERAASEAADLLYHAMVLLNAQGVPIADVMRVLRKRFGVSGVEEKAARPPKKQ